MPTGNRTTVTRRNALKSGGIAALVAGLTGAVVAPPVRAESEPRVTVVNADDLAAECRRLHAEMHALAGKELAVYRALEATLNAEQRTLLRALSDTKNDATNVEMDWRISEVARHLPGVAPAVMMIAEHTIVASYDLPGRCCTTATGFEA